MGPTGGPPWTAGPDGPNDGPGNARSLWPTAPRGAPGRSRKGGAGDRAAERPWRIPRMESVKKENGAAFAIGMRAQMCRCAYRDRNRSRPQPLPRRITAGHTRFRGEGRAPWSTPHNAPCPRRPAPDSRPAVNGCHSPRRPAKRQRRRLATDHKRGPSEFSEGLSPAVRSAGFEPATF